MSRQVDVVDVVVVGLGPGGEEVAGRLAEAGLAVVGIDGGLVGGECPYWGCIPSKMMVRAADLLAEGRRIPGMAGTSTVGPDWAPVARRIRDEATDDWDDTVAVERLEGKGATFVRGWARIDGPGRVVVGDQAFEATKALVLGVGAKAWAPPVPGLETVPYWTNRQAVECDVLPASLVVLGGGAIGLELGQVFSRFGVAVTVVEVADRLLPQEEPESSALIAEVFADEGIRVVTGATIERAEHAGGRCVLRLAGTGTGTGTGTGATAAAGTEISGDRLLVATGRRPDLAALGVAGIGLDESARAVPVDGRLRVAPGVWAVGDVTGKGAFTHVAMYQARIAVADILRQTGTGTGKAAATATTTTTSGTSPDDGDDQEEADYHALPRVTFTDPEIGSVGRTEEDARAAGLTVRVGTAQIPSAARGWIHKAGNQGFVKLVEDADRGVLVGATSAGPAGGEVLGLLALAVHADVPTARLRQMIYAYPTFHRAIEAALDDLAS